MVVKCGYLLALFYSAGLGFAFDAFRAFQHKAFGSAGIHCLAVVICLSFGISVHRQARATRHGRKQEKA